MWLYYILLGTYLYWYFKKGVCKPIISYNDKYWKKIIEKCPSLNKYYYPTIWVFYFQELALIIQFFKYRIINKYFKQTYRTEYIYMEDGERIQLDWFDKDTSDNLPIIVLFHGIVGSTVDFIHLGEFIKTTNKFKIVVFNRRGHNLPLTRPKFSIYGSIEDTRTVIQHIHKLYPNSNIYGAGFSAGCTTLIQYASEYGEESFLKANICISSVFDTDLMIKNTSSIISRMMIYNYLNTIIIPNQKVLQEFNSEGYLDILNSKTTIEMSNNISKYNNKKIITRDIIHHHPIVPTLFIHSQDDILFNKNIMRYTRDHIITKSNYCIVEVHKGGHVCFYEGITLNKWTDRVIYEYFNAIESNHI